MIDSDLIRKMGGVNPQPHNSDNSNSNNLILPKHHIVPRK